MNKQLLVGMLAGVVVLLVATPFVLDGDGSAGDASARLCPELEGHINDVRSVLVQSRTGTLTYDRDEDGAWSVREHGGYAASGQKIGTLLIALREARRLEPKSKKPENWQQLGVAEPGEESQSARIEVRGPEDALYADVIVGNRRTQGGADAAYYVREAGTDTPWLASGDLRPPASLRDWVDTLVLDVATNRVASVRIEHPDGATYLMQKGEEERAQLVPTELPEGKELQSEYVTSRFSSALARLSFEGVKSATATSFPDEDVATARFWTREGLLVIVETVEVDAGPDPDGEGPEEPERQTWARIRASYDPLAPVLREELEGPLTDDSGAGDLLAQEPEEEPETEGPTPEEVQAEADELNARTVPWIFVLPSYKAASFRTRLDDLLKDVPPPPEDEGDDGDAAEPPADGETGDGETGDGETGDGETGDGDTGDGGER
jgi:hypothetical protein